MASQEVLHVELPSINPYAGGASIPLGSGGNRNRQSSRSPPPKPRNRAPQDTRQRSQTPPRRASRRASPPRHRQSSRRQSQSPSRQPRFYTSENEDDELSDRPPPREAPRSGYSSPPPSRRYKATDHQSENPKNDTTASGRYVWTEEPPWDQRVSSKNQRPPDDEYYGEPEYIRVADRDQKKMNPPVTKIKEHEPVENKFYQSNAMPARTKSTAGGGKINHVVEESESANENFSEPIIVNRAASRVAKPAGRQSGSGVPQSSTQGKKPNKGKQPAIPGNIMSGEESEGAYGRNPEVSSEASDISGDESDDRYPRCRRCGHRHHPKRRECPRHKERRRPPACPPMCPPWLQPPFIPQWPWYDIPRLPCNPRALPYSYGRPVFADIPELPDLIKQLSMSYYSLPVPPLEMIRELREQYSGTIPENPEPTPPTKPVDGIRNFNAAYAILETPDKFDEKTPQGKTARFLSAMSGRETTFYLSDQITRMLTNMIQVRFAERKGTEIVNRSRLVPRGRLGMGITFDARTKLDYDLVIPGDFVLRRWNVNPPQPGSENRPRTMTEALGLSTAAIARGQIEALKLDWVIESVYQQLNGSADAFIFPGGAEEASRYLPPLLYDRYKNDVSGANRLRLMNPNPPISFINIYIKVALSVNGQDMIIGVDYSSARANGMYQMIKVSPAPGVPLGEAHSDPVDRSAIILLNWWKRGIKTGDVKIPNGTAPTSFTLRTNHFILALAALHKLDATDPLYVPRASQSAGPFSLERMLTVAHKILTYVERAYNSPRLFTTVPPSKDSENGREEYVFPLLSCTATDVLYTQAMAIPGQLDNLIASQVIPTMISRLAATISNLTVPASKTPIAPGPGPVAGPGPKTRSKFGWTA